MKPNMNKMDQKGFTLIELLVVTAIIGILASTAVSQYSHYRTKGYNSAAETDLRSAISAQEAYYLDNDTYSTTTAGLLGGTYGLYTSDGVTLSVTSADAFGYTMRAYHAVGMLTYTVAGPGGVITY